MARALRIDVENGVYHVISRGAVDRDLFRTDRDYVVFLERLETARDEFALQTLSYSLLRNHFHLVVRTPRANLSEAMHAVNSAYARGFLKRHELRGPVYAGRFKAPLVQTESYLDKLLHYVNTNPVKHGFCATPEQWQWSSHRAILGETAAGPVAINELFALLCGEESPDMVARGRARYRSIVGDPAHEDFEPRGPIIGDDDFVREHAPQARPAKEVDKSAWRMGRPSLAELATALSRDAFIVTARDAFGYSVTEIAEHLGCSPSAVSARGTRAIRSAA